MFNPLGQYDASAGYRTVSNDDFTQAGDLFRIMSADQQDRLMDTIAGAMSGVPSDIVERQLGYFRKADAAYGAGIAERPRGRESTTVHVAFLR